MIELRSSDSGQGRRIGIVVSRFNRVITSELLAGTTDALEKQGVAADSVVVAWVPGAWEIPAALARLNRSRDFDALIALGAVIRGATPHFEYIAGGVSNGVASIAAAGDVPVIFGVLTTDTFEQAFERAGIMAENKGRDFALAALEMANLFEEIDE